MARAPAPRCPACGKASFPTLAKARHAATLIARGTGNRRMHPYHCRDGACWHLTDQQRGQRGNPTNRTTRNRRALALDDGFNRMPPRIGT